MSSILIFISLLCHRWNISHPLLHSSAQIPWTSLAAGALEDASLVLLCMALAYGLSVLPRVSYRVALTFLALLAWIANLCNSLYFSFFGARLDAWIARLHAGDSYQVSGSALRLASSPPILLSIALFLAAILLLWKRKPAARRPLPLRALSSAALIGLALLVKQSPVWFHWMSWDDVEGVFKAGILGDQIVYVWWDQLKSDRGRTDETALLRNGIESPEEKLRRYATFSETPTRDPSAKDLRESLGLPVDGPIHVFVVFLESTRGYEYTHPWLAPRVVPRLSKLIRKNGIYFEQAYSSSMEPGQTARGLFSTLCGSLPNIRGPAIYIAYPDLRVDCIQQKLREAGYQTLSVQPFKSDYHNARAFESLHGTEEFYDKDDFLRAEPGLKTWGWGLTERDYFRNALALLERKAAEGKPIFAHFRTNATHHPFHGDPEDPLPADLVARVTDGEYLNYLQALHYSDSTVADFIEGIFRSSLGDRSLVVLSADHSLLRETGAIFPLQDYQYQELKARIPLALLTKTMKKPRRISYPVHQVDVAPTIARIVGVPCSPQWPGLGLLSGEGRPWVFKDDRGVHYRTQKRVCYASLRIAGKETCLSVSPTLDPLLNGNLQEIPEDPAKTKLFDDTIRADLYLIRTNRLTQAAQFD